jgi:uncharacterized phage protein gp47/JayE
MSFLVPDRESISSDFVADYSTAQPKKSVARGSIPYAFARAVSAVAWMVLSKLIYFDRNRLPDTSDRANLIREGNARNFPIRGPQGSSGALALQVTGTPASAIPVGSVLTHADGTSYQTTTVGAAIGGGGTAILDVAAISTGLATNKVAGEALTFQAPPAGVTAQAVLVANLANGLDDESTEQYRARLLAHIGDPPEGGSYADYLEWALKVPGAATAYVWRHRRGLGTIDVAVLGGGSGAQRVVTNLTPFTTYIEGLRPGNVKDWKMLVTVPSTQDVTASIAIDTTLYKWDWDDLGVGYVITAHNQGASTITVPTAPASVIAGVRIQVNGEEAKVTQRVGNVLTLAFSAPPVTTWNPNPVAPTWFVSAVVDNTSVIRCSGDLVVPVRTAILSMFVGLGPARSQYSAVAWDDSIRFSKLYARITDVAGVTDATLTTPGGNVSLIDTYGTSVPFLTPGNVQVLKQ